MRPSVNLFFHAFLAIFGLATACLAQTTVPEPAADHTERGKAADRSRYNLFNPTPPEQLRDFAPDRPNVTNGPFTVDPGHVIVEVGILEYTRDRYNNQATRLDSFALADTNIRLGVTNTVEVDCAFTSYTYRRTKDKVTGAHTKQSGFSDLQVRSKINLVGDDGGNFALGILPFFNTPTAHNGLGGRGFSGGLGTLVQFNLPAGFQLGMESVVQTTHELGGGSNFDFANSISLGRAITKRLATYLELATEVPTVANASWLGTVNTGLVYLAADNWEIDAGVNIGVTKAASDLLPFFGTSWRF
jgi:hypothetical protein